MEYTSAQERLRARQFRHPGLVEWKVFEIAGILPLVLQLSLGLFLLGLCIFTWSVNVGVGHSSAVLTLGWASLFVFVIIAPAFSPRCPYKTTILRSAMAIIRRRVVPPVYHRRLRPLWKDGVVPLSSALMSAGKRFTLAICILAGPLMLLVRPWWQHCTSYFRPTPRPSGANAQPLQSIDQRDWEECDAVRRPADDLMMLKEVDMYLLDDDLLGSSMFEALLQKHEPPGTILSFIANAINLRLGEQSTCALQFPLKLDNAPDLRGLMMLSWITVSDLVANTILHSLRRDTYELGWLSNALYLLFARTDLLLTPTARAAAVHSVQSRTMAVFLNTLASISVKHHDFLMPRLHDLFIPISDRLMALYEARELSPQEVVHFVRSILATELPSEAPKDVTANDFDTLLDLRALSQQTWDFALETLSKLVFSTLDTVEDPALVGSWLEEVIHIILSKSNYPAPLLADRVLAALCQNGPLYLRVERRLTVQMRPGDDDPHYMLSRFRKVRPHFTSEHSLLLFLETIAYISVCQGKDPEFAQSDHLVHLVQHFDGALHSDWIGQYIRIWEDILRDLDPGTVTAAWPVGSRRTLRAWLFYPSLVKNMFAEGQKIITSLLCSRLNAVEFLHPLLSLDPNTRKGVTSQILDQAISNIVALLQNTDLSGASPLIYAELFQ